MGQVKGNAQRNAYAKPNSVEGGIWSPTSFPWVLVRSVVVVDMFLRNVPLGRLNKTDTRDTVLEAGFS